MQPQHRLQLDILEHRETPAIIASVTSAGVLTITGSDNDNAITLLDTGAGMTITPTGDTVNGQASVTYPTVNAVRMILKKGTDSVTIDPANPFNLTGEFFLDYGDETASRTFTKTTGFATGNFTVRISGTPTVGAESVTIDGPVGTVTGAVLLETINCSTGFDVTGLNSTRDFRVNATGTASNYSEIKQLTVGGNFINTDPNNALLVFEQVTVTGNVNITHGIGFNAVTIRGLTVNGTGGFNYRKGNTGSYGIGIDVAPVNIPNGNFTVVSGTASTLTPNEIEIRQQLTIGGNYSVIDAGLVRTRLTASTAGTINAKSFSQTATGDSLFFSGNNTTRPTFQQGFTLTSRTKKADVYFGNALTVGTSLTVSAPANVAEVQIESTTGYTIPKDVRISSALDSLIDFNDAPSVTINGGLYVSSSSAATTATGASLQGDTAFTVTGPVSVTTGRAARISTLGSFTAPSVTVTGGNSGYLKMRNLTTPGNVTVTGASASAEFDGTSIVTGNLTVNGPRGMASVNLNGNFILVGNWTSTGLTHSVSLLGAADIQGTATIRATNTLSVNNALTISKIATDLVRFRKNVTLTAAAGLSQLSLNDGVQFDQNLTWTSTGRTTFNTYGTTLKPIAGNLSITTGSLNDNISLLDVAVAGNTTIRTGASYDNVTLGGASILTGTLLVDLSTAATSSNSFTLDGTARVIGNVTITGGTGNDDVTLSSTNPNPTNILFNGGTGSNQIGTTSAETYTGNITFNGSTGTDRFRLRGTLNGNVTCNFSSGNDSFSTTNSLSVARLNGNLTMNFGDGDDDFDAVRTEFNGTVSALMGNGNDEIDWDRGTVAFGNTTLDAGAGNDTLTFGIDVAQAWVGVNFKAKTTILAGTGNDTLFLGKSIASGGDANSVVQFDDLTSVVDGGIGGLDVPNIANIQTKLPMANITNW